MAYDPGLGKQGRILGLFFFLRFAPEAAWAWSEVTLEWEQFWSWYGVVGWWVSGISGVVAHFEVVDT